MSRITKRKYEMLLNNNIIPEPGSEKCIIGGRSRERKFYGTSLRKFDNDSFEERFEKWARLQDPDSFDDKRRFVFGLIHLKSQKFSLFNSVVVA